MFAYAAFIVPDAAALSNEKTTSSGVMALPSLNFALLLILKVSVNPPFDDYQLSAMPGTIVPAES